MHLKNMLRMVVLTATAPTTTATKYEIGKTGIDFIDQKTGIILGLLMGGVSVVGIYYVIKNIAELSTAIGDRDASTMKTAGLGLMGGIVMAGVSIILAILGFTV